MQLILGFFQVEIDPALNALGSEGHPFLKYFSDAHNSGRSGNENVEIAGKCILERGQLKELLHKLVGIYSPFEIDGYFLPSRPVSDRGCR